METRRSLYQYLQYCSVSIFYLWVRIVCCDPLLFVYSCVFPLHMYFVCLIQRKQKINNIFICSETYLHSQTEAENK